MKRLLLASVVIALVFAMTASARVDSHPPGLTLAGIALWNFEALLHSTFGSRSVCVVTGSTASGAPLSDSGDYVSPAGGCSPESTYSTYGYTFGRPTGSAFHLVSRHFKPGAFGNYPVPVRVDHLYVACNARSSTYLIEYGDAMGNSFACLTPS
jgi:hypothetical protein